MKTLYASLVVAGLAVIAGCNTSTTGGTPGGGTFKLKGPATTQDIKQGDTKSVEITADEDKNFKEDVALTAEVDPADKGVTASLDPTTIKAGSPKKTNLVIKATKEAASGEYKVNVTGKPPKGDATTVTVKVKVEKP